MSPRVLLGSLILAAVCALIAGSAPTSAATHDPTDAFPARPESEAIAEALAEAVHGEWTSVKNTGSMLPVLSAQDLVVTRPVDIRDLRVGDIIVFVVPSRTLPDGQLIQHPRVVHRVVQRLDCVRHRFGGEVVSECDRVRTQGDNVRTPDRWATTQANLAGRVAYVIDGRTNAVREMRTSRKGSPISTADALRRELGPDRLAGPLFADAVRALAGG